MKIDTAVNLAIVAGVGVAAFMVYRAVSGVPGAVGELLDDVGDTIADAGNSLASTIYPESMLPKDETVGSVLDARYNQPVDTRSFLAKAWDGYWQDVSGFWGSTPAPELWGREVREPAPAWTGGASGSW